MDLFFVSQVLLPLDALKIKRQVNPEAFRGRGVYRIFMEEGTTLYRGWGWTMARNAPGSFAVRIFLSSNSRTDNLIKNTPLILILFIVHPLPFSFCFCISQ
jgi:hypothetical protein